MEMGIFFKFLRAEMNTGLLGLNGEFMDSFHCLKLLLDSGHHRFTEQVLELVGVFLWDMITPLDLEYCTLFFFSFLKKASLSLTLAIVKYLNTYIQSLVFCGLLLVCFAF